MFCFFSLLLRVLPLSDRGGFSFYIFPCQVKIGAVHEVVFLHVCRLRVCGLLPLFSDPPAWARAAEPDPLVVFLGGEGCLGSCQSSSSSSGVGMPE